jgi:hypothetical protein
MNRAIDVTTEMRKLTSSKPLQAAAGAGALASEALRELPARIARWRPEVSVTALPSRASEVVTTARAKAARGYDHLAVRGERVLAGKGALAGNHALGQGAPAGESTVAGKSAVVSKNTAAAKSAVAGKSTATGRSAAAGKSTTAGKSAGNGKAR